MTKLSDFLSAHLAGQELDQKSLSVAFLHALESRAPDDHLELSTVTTKLSKLMGGKEEGEKFFFASADRAGAFAAALKVDPERLTALRDAWVVVLHPRLPEAAIAYLVDRSNAEDATFVAHVVTSTDDLLTAMRDVARASSRSIVVLPDDRDVPFFAGADVRTTRVEKHPRGWLLVAQPDLVPLPPPPPPATWAGDSTPLFRCDVLAQRALDEWERRKKEPVYFYHQRGGPHDDVLGRGEEPRFRLEEIASARAEQLRAARVELHGRGYAPNGGVVLATLLGSATHTHVWSRGRRVFAIGPNVAAARDVLGGEVCPHELEVPASLARLRGAFDTWNPWTKVPAERSGDESRMAPPLEPWASLMDEVSDECGVNIAEACTEWWRQTRGAPEASISMKPVASEAVRRKLVELSQRELETCLGDASVAFQIQAAARAPLLELAPSGRESFHVLANLGAGRLLDIRCFRYPYEAATPLRGDKRVLVGGDVALLLTNAFDPLLESSELTAVRRRKVAEEEEARRRHDDDD